MSSAERPPPRPRLPLWGVPRRDRAFVLDELERLYSLRARDQGRRAAARWYRGELWAFRIRVPLERLGVLLRHTAQRAREVFMIGLLKDVRLALRSLASAPGFTATAVMALVLGIGANTLIFSVVDAIVLRPLGYPQADRLVALWPDASMLLAELDYIRSNSSTLEGVGGYRRTDGFNVELAAGSRRLDGHLVASETYDVLGVTMAHGRNFSPRESTPAGDAVALVAHGFWQRELGADPAAVGTTVRVDGRPHTIVGVLPRGLAFPDADQQIVLPLVFDTQTVGSYWGLGGFHAVGRLRNGIEPQAAQEDLRNLARQTRELNPLWTPAESFRANTTVVPLRDAVIAGVRGNLLVMLATVGLVLLAACANVANLLLARGLSRSADVALRAALGAGRGRLVREQMIEGMTLVGLGCVAALLTAAALLPFVVSLLPAEIPRTGEIRLDARVIAVGVASALLGGLLATALPARHAAGADPGAALRAGGRRQRASRHHRLSATLVVAQIAVAVVLLTAAGLLARSLGALGSVAVGFEPDGVTTARITMTGDGYEDAPARVSFLEAIGERAAALPGVEAAGLVTQVPFDVGWNGFAMFVEGVTEDPNSLPTFVRRAASPGALRVLGIPLLRGRPFATSDRDGTPLVALVDEIAAARFWPGEDPVGQRIRYPWRGAPWVEIVGVVGGVADGDLAAARVPGFYVPLAQAAPAAATLVLRAPSGATVDAAAIRATVEQEDPAVAVSRVGSATAGLAASMARARWSTILLTAFAGVTLLLGSVGVYGLVAYAVGGRTRDYGVRMALGAAPTQILRSVLRAGTGLALPGAILGALLSAPAALALDGMLFGIEPLDPLVFGLVPLVLALATMVAVYVPARRATRVDPARTLRE